MQPRFNIIFSPLFLFSLAILLINDFFLKDLFHNTPTGKLSDFTGLIVFPLFFSAFFYQYRNHIFIATGLLFCWWKSPLSTGFIDFWNEWFFLNIGRTVDYSDWMALSVLPFAYYRCTRREISLLMVPIKLKNGCKVFISAISLFAIAATSYQKDFDYSKTYEFDIPKDELIRKINGLTGPCNNAPLSLNIANTETIMVNMQGTTFAAFTRETLTDSAGNAVTGFISIDTIFVNDTIPFSFSIYSAGVNENYCTCISGKLLISGTGSRSQLTILEIHTSNCYGMFTRFDDEKEKLLENFERVVIAKIE